MQEESQLIQVVCRLVRFRIHDFYSVYIYFEDDQLKLDKTNTLRKENGQLTLKETYSTLSVDRQIKPHEGFDKNTLDIWEGSLQK